MSVRLLCSKQHANTRQSTPYLLRSSIRQKKQTKQNKHRYLPSAKMAKAIVTKSRTNSVRSILCRQYQSMTSSDRVPARHNRVPLFIVSDLTTKEGRKRQNWPCLVRVHVIRIIKKHDFCTIKIRIYTVIIGVFVIYRLMESVII